jgi:hypothetical protein
MAKQFACRQMSTKQHRLCRGRHTILCTTQHEDHIDACECTEDAVLRFARSCQQQTAEKGAEIDANESLLVSSAGSLYTEEEKQLFFFSMRDLRVVHQKDPAVLRPLQLESLSHRHLPGPGWPPPGVCRWASRTHHVETAEGSGERCKLDGEMAVTLIVMIGTGARYLDHQQHCRPLTLVESQQFHRSRVGCESQLFGLVVQQGVEHGALG